MSFYPNTTAGNSLSFPSFRQQNMQPNMQPNIQANAAVGDLQHYARQMLPSGGDTDRTASAESLKSDTIANTLTSESGGNGSGLSENEGKGQGDSKRERKNKPGQKFGAKKKSWVWSWFVQDGGDPSSAACDYCGKLIKRMPSDKGSPKKLSEHLRTHKLSKNSINTSRAIPVDGNGIMYSSGSLNMPYSSQFNSHMASPQMQQTQQQQESQQMPEQTESPIQNQMQTHPAQQMQTQIQSHASQQGQPNSGHGPSQKASPNQQMSNQNQMQSQIQNQIQNHIQIGIQNPPEQHQRHHHLKQQYQVPPPQHIKKRRSEDSAKNSKYRRGNNMQAMQAMQAEKPPGQLHDLPSPNTRPHGHVALENSPYSATGFHRHLLKFLVDNKLPIRVLFSPSFQQIVCDLRPESVNDLLELTSLCNSIMEVSRAEGADSVGGQASLSEARVVNTIAHELIEK